MSSGLESSSHPQTCPHHEVIMDFSLPVHVFLYHFNITQLWVVSALSFLPSNWWRAELHRLRSVFLTLQHLFLTWSPQSSTLFPRCIHLCTNKCSWTQSTTLSKALSTWLGTFLFFYKRSFISAVWVTKNPAFGKPLQGEGFQKTPLYCLCVYRELFYFFYLSFLFGVIFCVWRLFMWPYLLSNSR